MTDKITNIEELHELVNPELLTTKQSCYKMIANAISNENLIKNYVKEVIKKLAKLENKKVFTQKSTYNVDYLDYYVNSKSNNIESCVDSLYGEIIDYGDGHDFKDFEELKE